MALTLSIPVRQVPLDRFGGLYTEADQRDLPIGSSPLNSDCDFLIGSTTVRPGLVSIQSFTNGGTISSSATLDYLKGALFTWTNSVGPVILFQSDDGNFWIDYEVSGNATLIYSGFLNNARMLSETFAQYEYCALGNWGNISSRAPLQGVDQPRTFTVQTAIAGSSGPNNGNNSTSVTTVNIAALIPVRQNLVAISGQGGTIPAGNPGANQQGIAIDLGTVPVHPNLTPNDKITVHGTGTYDGLHTVSIVQNTPGSGVMLVFGGPGVGGPPMNPAPAGSYVQYELVTVDTTPTHFNPSPGSSVTISGAPSGYNGTWIVRQNEVVPFQIVVLIPGASVLANGTGGIVSIGGGGSSGGSTGGGSTGGGSTAPTFNISSFVPVRQNIVAISGNGGTIPSGTYANQQAIAVSLGSQPVHPNLAPGMTVTITGTSGYYDGNHTVAIIQNTPGSGVMSLVNGKGVGVAHIIQTGKVQYDLTTVTTNPGYNPLVKSYQNVLGANPSSYNGIWQVVQGEVVANQIVLLINGASVLGNGSGGTIQGAAGPGGTTQAVAAQFASVQTTGVISPATTQFDRISQVAPASNNWGVSLSGSASLTTGIGALAYGTRYGVLMYQMENGYITPASVPIPVTLGANPGTGFGFTDINLSNLPTGPPGTVNIIFAMTIPVTVPAGVVLPPNTAIGGPYFWVPTNNVPNQTNYGTVIPNGTANTTIVTMSDVVLTSGVNITVPGNNLLAGHQRELGEMVKVINYGARAWYLGERTKVDGFVNMTFDGGTSTDGSIGGWPLSGGSFQLIPSPIYGLTLQINGGGGHLSQIATFDAFGVPILQPNTQYNARITAWSQPAGAQVGLVINGGPTVMTPPLTTTPAEYALFNLITTGSNPANNGSLSVVNQNVPSGGIIYVDRIEVYPAVQPVYSHQLIGSYIENYQAVDAQTGVLDTSEFTYEAQTNAFRFLQSLYITTENHTFTTSTDPTSEPSGWSIQEVSNAAGCIGPAAADVGEEYVLMANRKGLYLFDGGNHVMLSQEIQSLWEQIYWPSATQIWVKNDLHKYRLFVGVPMVTPNQWLPNAPPMATPTKPNVILMCNYRGDATGAEIAASPGVHVSSFTGQLLARDFTRKWSPWLINSAYGTVIEKGAQSGNLAGAEQVWFGGESNGTVWLLDPTARTDNGTNPIPQVYTTYGFADEMTADAKQLLTTRRLYSYLTVTCEGQGGMVLTTLPESLNTPYADPQPVVTIAPIQTNRNIPINETGDRLFLQFTPDGNPGSYFTLHRVVLGVQPDPWIPITGSDEGEILLGKYGGSQ